MTWSAAQYVAFEGERTRPVRDLLAAVPPFDVHSAVDIGCGPGNSTEVLAARFPLATIAGLDSSADMIAAARKRLPDLNFEVADINTWIGADTQHGDAPPIDLILANAVLQWIPDHAGVFPALVKNLASGGCLAVQMPDNLDEPAQTLMRDVARAGRWSRKLVTAEQARVPIEAAGWYYDLLQPSCARVDVWRCTYYHPLAGEDDIVEWFKGTGLRPFIDLLDASERDEYLAVYKEKLKTAYPRLGNGGVLLPFPRLFIVAIRS